MKNSESEEGQGTAENGRTLADIWFRSRELQARAQALAVRRCARGLARLVKRLMGMPVGRRHWRPAATRAGLRRSAGRPR